MTNPTSLNRISDRTIGLAMAIRADAEKLLRACDEDYDPLVRVQIDVIERNLSNLRKSLPCMPQAQE